MNSAPTTTSTATGSGLRATSGGHSAVPHASCSAIDGAVPNASRPMLFTSTINSTMPPRTATMVTTSDLWIPGSGRGRRQSLHAVPLRNEAAVSPPVPDAMPATLSAVRFRGLGMRSPAPACPHRATERPHSVDQEYQGPDAIGVDQPVAARVPVPLGFVGSAEHRLHRPA